MSQDTWLEEFAKTCNKRLHNQGYLQLKNKRFSDKFKITANGRVWELASWTAISPYTAANNFLRWFFIR